MLFVESKQNIIVKGKYYWELLFDIDNSQNESSITMKESYEIVKKVNYKTFLTNTNKINIGYTYDNKQTASLSLSKISAGSEVNHSFHIDMANELTAGFEKNEDTTESYKKEKEFNVGPKSKSKLYRLVYESDGQINKTDIISTEPKDNAIVELEFLYKIYLPGFDLLADTLMNIRPKVDNIKEWENLRQEIIKYSDVQSNNTRFFHLLETMSVTTPLKQNKEEWSQIRKTCEELLKVWDTNDDKVFFLKKFVKMLSTITPRSANKEEWKKIREVAGAIDTKIKPI